MIRPDSPSPAVAYETISSPSNGTAAPTGAGAGCSQLRPRGSNHVGMRQYNERVVLQAIRLHGELPKADLARLTRLSTQTISLIVNKLLDERLLVKREPLRGRIGQPSVPIALNPDGAYSVGVEIGRRDMDVLLIDFVGRVRHRARTQYAFPDPDRLFDTLAPMLGQALHTLGTPAARARVSGVGIAAPLSLGGWTNLLGVSDALARRWDEVDMPQRLAGLTDLPLHFIKDTAAACVAELVAGEGRTRRSFLYLFVDTFIGGGLVLDSHLFAGHRGNAGAVGSMPLHVTGAGPAPAQVLSCASLLSLQRHYEHAGLDPDAATDERALELPWAEHTQVWLANAARSMALAIINAACLLDLGDIVIDGVFSRRLLARLISHVESALDLHCWEGVTRPQIHPGSIGADARALGGAMLPLYADYAPDPEVFLKADPLRGPAGLPATGVSG